MIRYKKYKNTQTGSVAYNQWYGRAVTEVLEFDDFIKHMANHHCVFGESTIRGVLIEMQICLRELLLEGKAVRLDDTAPLNFGGSATKESDNKGGGGGSSTSGGDIEYTEFE